MLRALVVTACAAEVAGFAPTFLGTNNNALRTQGGVRASLQAPMMRSSQSDDADASSLSTSRRKVLELGSMAALSLMLPGPAFAKRLSDMKQPMDEVDPNETPEDRKERKKREREEYRLKQKVCMQIGDCTFLFFRYMSQKSCRASTPAKKGRKKGPGTRLYRCDQWNCMRAWPGRTSLGLVCHGKYKTIEPSLAAPHMLLPFRIPSSPPLPALWRTQCLQCRLAECIHPPQNIMFAFWHFV
jgi:hypothetical protein